MTFSEPQWSRGRAFDALSAVALTSFVRQAGACCVRHPLQYLFAVSTEDVESFLRLQPRPQGGDVHLRKTGDVFVIKAIMLTYKTTAYTGQVRRGAISKSPASPASHIKLQLPHAA